MNTQTSESEPLPSSSAPTAQQPMPSSASSSRKLTKTTYRNMKFLGVALALVIILFSLLAGLMRRQPQNSQSEVKQKEYNVEFDSLTPSTSQLNNSDERKNIEAVSLDDLDTEFKSVDQDINQL